MCLQIDKTQTDEIKSKFKTGEVIEVYKVAVLVDFEGKKRLMPPVYPSTLYQCGANLSDRDSTMLTDKESKDNRIFLGFHVFLDKNEADVFLDKEILAFEDKKAPRKYTIVECEVDIDSFVAAGTFMYYSPEGLKSLEPGVYKSAVFSKMNIRQEEYDRAIGEAEHVS